MTRNHGEIGSAVVNEKIYVCGGKDFHTKTLSGEVFDPSLNQWSSIAPMNRITEPVKLAAYNGRLFAIGRRLIYSNDRTIVEDSYLTEIYDPDLTQWSDGPMKPCYEKVGAMGMIPFS